MCKGKVEEMSLERVDVLVSEPMGTLLVNERMLETYVYARKHFLKPGGKMFPVIGVQSVQVLLLFAAAAAFWCKNGGHRFGRDSLTVSLWQQVGRIHAALFSDEILYAEILGKAAFWLQYQYFGVDITRLHAPSVAGYFSQAGPLFWQVGISPQP